MHGKLQIKLKGNMHISNSVIMQAQQDNVLFAWVF